MERLDKLLEELQAIVERVPGAVLRVRRPYESKPFVVYAALPARWSGEKRILVILVAENGALVIAVAPPVPHPYCVSRGREDVVEAKAVDEALYELGSRYTSWCRVYIPPGLRSPRLTDILSEIVSLGVVDEISPWSD